jgi:GxxExxY protein
MKYEDITDKIIQSAFNVHRTLGFGFLEKVYENSLAYEMKLQGLTARQQIPLQVKYKDTIVGEYFADILVDDCIIVELKSCERVAKEHEVQLVNYLKATGLDVGLLINFGKSFEIKRKTRDLSIGF